MLALTFSRSTASFLATRRAAVLGASAAIASSPWPARADTTQSICQKLDNDAPSRNARGHPAEQLEIVVGPPGFDSWCPVEVSAPLIVGTDHIDYLWLKDARTESCQRIYAARSFTGEARVPRLAQNLKKGYVFKPMAYCSAHGLWEGDLSKCELDECEQECGGLVVDVLCETFFR